LNCYDKTIYKNPAETYLLSLDSPVNIKNSTSALKRICKILSGDACYLAFNWSLLDYTKLIDLKFKLRESGLSAGSINTYLAIMKGACKEAWRQKIISTDDYLHIKDVKRMKGTRLPAGRALSPNEINSLIKFCSSSKKKSGIRNAAIIALTYGAGQQGAYKPYS
jgi:integrase/recombinase XerD